MKEKMLSNKYVSCLSFVLHFGYSSSPITINCWMGAASKNLLKSGDTSPGEGGMEQARAVAWLSDCSRKRCHRIGDLGNEEDEG